MKSNFVVNFWHESVTFRSNDFLLFQDQNGTFKGWKLNFSEKNFEFLNSHRFFTLKKLWQSTSRQLFLLRNWILNQEMKWEYYEFTFHFFSFFFIKPKFSVFEYFSYKSRKKCSVFVEKYIISFVCWINFSIRKQKLLWIQFPCLWALTFFLCPLPFLGILSLAKHNTESSISFLS